MYSYTCDLCNKTYEDEKEEKNAICFQCRKDYEISDEHIYGNKISNIDPPHATQNTYNLTPPSNQEILNYYMYGDQYSESPCVPTRSHSNSQNRYVPKKVDFNVTKEISLGVWSGVIRVDDRNKLWYYSSKKNTNSPVYHKFSDIASYELCQDSDVVFKKGGTGRAVAGGLMFGSVGAIVGSNTAKRKTATVIHEMYIRVSFKNISTDYVKIPLCENTKTDSLIYMNARKMADQILSLFDAMVSQAQMDLDTEIYNQTKQNPQKPAPVIFSPADEIQKFKALLDCGAITEDEYETAKKRLLNF